MEQAQEAKAPRQEDAWGDAEAAVVVVVLRFGTLVKSNKPLFG